MSVKTEYRVSPRNVATLLMKVHGVESDVITDIIISRSDSLVTFMTDEALAEHF